MNFSINGMQGEYLQQYKGGFTWTLAGSASEIVEKLNPELAKEVVKLINIKIELVKQEEINKKLEADRIKNEKAIAFSNKVMAMLTPNFTVEKYAEERCSIKINEISVDLYKDEIIYTNGYSHKTSKPWLLIDFNYKRTRYSTIEGAVKAAMSLINEKVQNIKQQKEKDSIYNDIKNAIIKKLHANGITCNSETNYDKYSNKWEKLSAEIKVSDKCYMYGKISGNENDIKINDIKLTTNLTVDQFKKIAELIKGVIDGR